jgi:hypothetical protein
MSVNTGTNTLLALETGVALSVTYDISLDESANDVEETVTACTYYINYSATELQALFDVSHTDASSLSVIPNIELIRLSIEQNLRTNNVFSTVNPSGEDDFDISEGRKTLVDDIQSEEYENELESFKKKIAHKFTIGQGDKSFDGSSNNTDAAFAVLKTLNILPSSITDFNFDDYHDNITVVNNGSAPHNLADDLLDAENILTANGTGVDFESLPDGYAFAVGLTMGGTMSLQLTVNLDNRKIGSGDNSDLTGQIVGQVVSQTHSFAGTTVNIALRKFTPAE